MGRGKRNVSIGMSGRSLSEFKLIEAVFESLRERKLDKVEIVFYGGGDESHVEQMNLEPELSEEEAGDIEERLDQVFETILNCGARGWQDEDGSYGTMALDVNAGSIDVDFHWNEQTTSDDAETYSLKDLDELRQGAAKGKRDWLSEPLGKIGPLFEELERRGVATVVGRYNGGGDDGMMEEIDYEPLDEDRPEGEDLLDGLDVEPLAFTVVGLQHSGWENNNGGYGEVVFDVQAREVRLSHSDYVMTTRADPFALEGFIPFEIVKLKRGPRGRVSALAD